MQKGFLGSGGGGGNHKKKDGSKARNDSTSQSAKLDDTANMVSSTMDNHVVASVNASNLESFPTVSKVHGICSSVNAVKSGGESYPPLPTQGTTPAGNTPGKSSYANVIGESIYPSGLRILLMASSWASEWLNPLLLVMLGTLGLYGCLNSMLDNDPWFIRNHPLILRKWNPDVDLLKEDVRNVPFWVKLHGVPIMAFSEDGLSSIAMKLDTSLMLDSYTSDMFLQSWGRSSYARVMIELWADLELKDTIVVAMPKIMREGYYIGFDYFLIN
ncbi:putative reverse transcriptase domain-containing protein [Tanacetum coccineum]